VAPPLRSRARSLSGEEVLTALILLDQVAELTQQDVVTQSVERSANPSRPRLGTSLDEWSRSS